jgi:hypothetical protein
MNGNTIHRIVLGSLMGAVLVLPGCKKHSPACKKAADITSPWKEMALPVDDGRVCESSGEQLKLEYHGKDKEKWAGAIEAALTAVGWAKEKCPSYCIYTKEKSRVQVIVGDISEKWVTVSMHLTEKK